MARFADELPNDLIKQFEELAGNTDDIFGEMVEAGAEVVHKNILNKMRRSFKDTKTLEKGLRVTKVYKTPSDDGINIKIGFYGYDTSKASKRYPKGMPIPLIALAREYGTSRGEAKRPFFRVSFKKREIEDAMKAVEQKYIKED